MLKDQSNHLNDVLSLYSNEYLACRWSSFLDNVPEYYINVRFYSENKRLLKNRVVRRKILNGNLYGFDNKLAPIPQFNHSRALMKETFRIASKIKIGSGKIKD